MNTTVNPQPQLWAGQWLYLNYLYNTIELAQYLDYRNGIWHWRIDAEPRPKRKHKHV